MVNDSCSFGNCNGSETGKHEVVNTIIWQRCPQLLSTIGSSPSDSLSRTQPGTLSLLSLSISLTQPGTLSLLSLPISLTQPGTLLLLTHLSHTTRHPLTFYLSHRTWHPLTLSLAHNLALSHHPSLTSPSPPQAPPRTLAWRRERWWGRFVKATDWSVLSTAALSSTTSWRAAGTRTSTSGRPSPRSRRTCWSSSTTAPWDTSTSRTSPRAAITQCTRTTRRSSRDAAISLLPTHTRTHQLIESFDWFYGCKRIQQHGY